MTYSVHLRLHDNLVGVARVIRILRRHAVIASEVAIEHRADREVANVRGTLRIGRNARALADALVRTPNVAHAVILDDTEVVAEFSRRLAAVV